MFILYEFSVQKVMCDRLLKFLHTDKQWWDKWNDNTIIGIHSGLVDSKGKGEKSQR